VGNDDFENVGINNLSLLAMCGDWRIYSNVSSSKSFIPKIGYTFWHIRKSQEGDGKVFFVKDVETIRIICKFAQRCELVSPTIILYNIHLQYT
jgi:hypothetical protein